MIMVYSFDKKDLIPVIEGEFNMGEKNQNGDFIYLNNLYFTKNGMPFNPVMGELHISRVPRNEWKDRILKMKAAGINIISSYLFWINHEFTEGKIDFTGENDISYFIKLCKDYGMYFALRIGPWVNAEYRNGGFPDWLYTSGITLRDNNDEYLFYVKRWYQAIYDNVKELLFKNGGNIIMIQFDNELVNKPEHIKKLKDIATEIGLTAPIYTATGWNMRGGAMLPQNEVVPMWGGYAAKPWTAHIKQIPISAHYNFSPVRNSAEIGNDLIAKMDFDVHIPLDHCPNSWCELGTGICISKHRRPYISTMDDYSMVLTKIGSGCNLLGYYLFCGGINKMINGVTLNKGNNFDKKSNYYPMFNTYFQAPIGEHGNIRESYRYIKMLNLFVNDYGSELAQMQPVYQKNTPERDNDTDLRYAMRVKDDSGYIFVNHHVHLLDLKPVKDVQFNVSESLIVPETPIRVTNDDAFFMPFNIKYGNDRLTYCTAQPICKSENVYFFKEICGVEPVFKFENETIIKAQIGKNNGFIHNGSLFVVLSQTEAEFVFKNNGQIFIGDNCDLIFDGEKVMTNGFEKLAYYHFENGKFVHYESDFENELATASYCEISNPEIEDGYLTELKLTLNPDLKVTGETYKETDRKIKYFSVETSGENGYVHIKYEGDSAQLYINGKFTDDDFYNGDDWIIPAKTFYNNKATVVISEYTEDIYLDITPKNKCEIISVSVENN